VTTHEVNDDQLHPYRLGITFDIMPIPIAPERSVDIPAGPVLFVVEARELTTEIMMQGLREAGLRTPDEHVAGQLELDDSGMSLHVLGSGDGLEYLRFDCFDKEPHYHYLSQRKQLNTVCRIDNVSEPDPVGWALARIAERLPEMLEHADAHDLAAQVRSQWPLVVEALPTAAALLRGNHHKQ
jgi:hypothetical protein